MRRLHVAGQSGMAISFPWPYFVFRMAGGAVGAFVTHIDVILRCGEPGSLARNRVLSGHRFGAMKGQESPPAYMGMEPSQESDLLEKLTQEEFTTTLEPTPYPTELWAARQQPPSPGAIKLRQC